MCTPFDPYDIPSNQFRRPEKDHAAQLHALHELSKTHPEYFRGGKEQVKLVLVGGSRNAEDAARVEGLRALAKDLDIEVRVLNYMKTQE